MKSSKPFAIVGAAESDLGKVPGMTSLDLQQAAARALRDAGLALRTWTGCLPMSTTSSPACSWPNTWASVRATSIRPASAACPTSCTCATRWRRSRRACARWRWWPTAAPSCRTARARSAARLRTCACRAGNSSPLWPAQSHWLLRDGGAAAHAALRHHPSRPGGSGGGGAQMGAAQSPCLPARGHVDRRGDGLAPDRGPAAPARLLPGDRCRRRLHPDHGRARPLAAPPAGARAGHRRVLSHHYTPFNTSDWLDTNVAATADAALAMAGVTRQDIDVVQIYDHFTIGVIQSLEELGFCKRGEGGAFVAGGGWRRAGLSHQHLGRRPVLQPSRAVRHAAAARSGAPVAQGMRRAATAQGRAGAGARARPGVFLQYHPDSRSLTMETVQRPLPQPTRITQPYWDAARRAAW